MKFNFDFGRFKALSLNLFLLLIAYTASRFIFYFSNHHVFAMASTREIISAFLIGIRFDFATVCFLNALYVILFLLPFSFVLSRGYQTFLKVFFFFCNFTFFAAQMGDTEYYKFTGSRMTLAIFAIGEDVKNQFGQLVFHYWFLALLYFIIFGLVWHFYRRANLAVSRPWFLYLAACIASMVVLFGGARGTVGSKGLTPAYAFTVTEGHMGILALNSAFTILKSSTKDHLAKIEFYPDQASAVRELTLPEYKYVGPSKPQNVMIIILESFATEFWGVANGGDGYTPFLDSLAKDGLFFRNSFANGRRSIEAVPSILLSIPSLMEQPIAKSKFTFNQWNGIGTAVTKHGYSTAFFHGAERGSMHFDSIAAIAGIKNYYGLEDYPNQKDYDGNWGIWDEQYLQYVGKKLGEMPKPFLAAVFTLSSHQPYSIPPQYKGQFRKGPTPLHESIGYTDHSLKVFFDSIKNEPWFKDTLFIFTGDHTQMSPSVNYATTLGTHMVPILFYHPGVKLVANTEKVVQHSDISPSILDFLGIHDEKMTLFGRSVFQDEPGRAVFFENGTYFLVEPKVAADYDAPKNKMTYYKFSDPNTAQPVTETPSAKLESELKAFVQYFNNGLNDKSLYDY